jgi:gluconokinase
VTTRLVIIMGVTGSGKTTVARALADRLHWPFCDADDLHTLENIERMRQGIPLDDEQRQPWLARIRRTIESTLAREGRLVVACSALKERYRSVLTTSLEGVRVVHLTAPPAVLRDRLRHRPDHFAGVSLLDSQLSALEPPRDALTLDATLPVGRLVDAVIADLSRRGSDSG